MIWNTLRPCVNIATLSYNKAASLSWSIAPTYIFLKLPIIIIYVKVKLKELITCHLFLFLDTPRYIEPLNPCWLTLEWFLLGLAGINIYLLSIVSYIFWISSLRLSLNDSFYVSPRTDDLIYDCQLFKLLWLFWPSLLFYKFYSSIRLELIGIFLFLY